MDKPKAHQSYLSEKLYVAIDSGLFVDDPAVMAECFHVLARGLENDPNAWYLQQYPDAKDNAQKIADLIRTTEADQASADGGWNARARRMTREERSALGQAMLSLYTHLMEVDHKP